MQYNCLSYLLLYVIFSATKVLINIGEIYAKNRQNMIDYFFLVCIVYFQNKIICVGQGRWNCLLLHFRTNLLGCSSDHSAQDSVIMGTVETFF